MRTPVIAVDSSAMQGRARRRSSIFVYRRIRGHALRSSAAMHGEPCPPSLRAAAAMRIGAIAFICHIGPAPDAHRDFHSVVIDGVLAPTRHRGRRRPSGHRARSTRHRHRASKGTSSTPGALRAPRSARTERRPGDGAMARHVGYTRSTARSRAMPALLDLIWSILPRVGGCPLDGWSSESTTVL